MESFHSFFYFCDQLETIILKEGVESSNNSFRKCIALKTITIPKSFKQFMFVPFNGCTHLEEIIVHQDNPNFKSIEGVLYSKDETILIKYPQGKQENEFTIPASVIQVNNNAFYNLLILENVIVPLNVTKVQPKAFQSERLTIFVRASDKPDGWDDEWYFNCLNIIWNYSG